MATTPHAEQIVEGILEELRGIRYEQANTEGYVYKYTAKQVMRVPFYEVTMLDSLKYDGPYYFVRDDGEIVVDQEINEFFEQGWAMDVPVLLAHRDNRAQTDATREDPAYISSGTVQNYMVGDVVAALTADEKRGIDAIYRTTVTRIDRDFHNAPQQWVLAEVFFNVNFVRPLGNP